MRAQIKCQSVRQCFTSKKLIVLFILIFPPAILDKKYLRKIKDTFARRKGENGKKNERGHSTCMRTDERSRRSESIIDVCPDVTEAAI